MLCQLSYKGRCQELDREFCIYKVGNAGYVMGIFNEFWHFKISSIIYMVHKNSVEFFDPTSIKVNSHAYTYGNSSVQIISWKCMV